MEQKHRSEFPEKELWDLTALYQDREDFLRAIEKTREDINQFSRDYKGNLHTFEDFEKAFAELEQIYIQMSHIAITPLCLRRQTIAMKSLLISPKLGWNLKLMPA